VAHPRLALLGRGSCPEGQRGRSRRGREKAARCGGPQAGERHLHLGACRGHPGLQEGRNAGRDQHQNLAAGHRYHPERRGGTSAHPDRRGRFAEPSGGRRERVGDPAQASPPVGPGRRPVRRARRSSERTGRHQPGAGPGQIASSGRLRHYPGRAAREAGSVCRSSATGGHGSREEVGWACRSLARQQHRDFAGLAPGLPHERSAGLAVAVRVVLHRPSALAARQPCGPDQVPKALRLALMARRPWLVARPARYERQRARERRRQRARERRPRR